jgi:hypothetical protein
MMPEATRLAVLVCFLVGWTMVQSQVVVPFVSNVDRSMVFHGRRFMEVDARPPEQAFAMDGALFFQDSEGQLGYFSVEARRTKLVERGGVDELQVAGERAAWRKADSLKVLRSGTGVLVATGVETFRVTDSLLVILDSVEHELVVFWNGRRYPLATVEQGSDRPQWTQGGNTVTFYDRTKRAVSIFHRGVLRTLTDSTDVGLVVTGTDIVGYWDDVRDEFMGETLGPPQRLSGMKPVSAQAGDGILAFIDGTLKLSCWTGGEVVQLTDSMPSQYWVKDRLLLYLWEGGLMMCSGNGPIQVEAYVPEHWQVEGDLLVYLDINRELRGIRNGERLRFGSEASIDGFQVYGDAVLYRSPAGPITVVHDGRSHTF